MTRHHGLSEINYKSCLRNIIVGVTFKPSFLTLDGGRFPFAYRNREDV
jgi:hypothetical protein